MKLFSRFFVKRYSTISMVASLSCTGIGLILAVTSDFIPEVGMIRIIIDSLLLTNFFTMVGFFVLWMIFATYDQIVY